MSTPFLNHFDLTGPKKKNLKIFPQFCKFGDYKKLTRSCPHHPLWGATKKVPCLKSSWECAETQRYWSNLLNDSCMPQNPCQWLQHGHGACQQITHNLVTMYGLKLKELGFSHRSYIRWPKIAKNRHLSVSFCTAWKHIGMFPCSKGHFIRAYLDTI